jgi:hypothetical protein
MTWSGIHQTDIQCQWFEAESHLLRQQLLARKDGQAG